MEHWRLSRIRPVPHVHVSRSRDSYASSCLYPKVTEARKNPYTTKTTPNTDSQPPRRRATVRLTDRRHVTVDVETTDLKKRPTCKELEDHFQGKKKNGGLTSCGVGARWCLGQSPAIFGVGRPCGRRGEEGRGGGRGPACESTP